VTIEIAYISEPEDFPEVARALKEPNGLLGFGYRLTTELLQTAYSRGIFPWFNEGEPVFWWSPDPRAVFYPDRTRPPRSLSKVLRKPKFKVTLNHAFQQVIHKCGEPHPNRPATWITPEMIQAYCLLHQQGFAHSVEVWLDNELVGGLYGVSLGKLFFGESMFHRATDASKVALFYLIEHCKSAGFPVIDCQLPNPHLMRLGAKELSRNDFMDYLSQYKGVKIECEFWQPKQLSDHYRF
jgi:leucyl/phenylalanyl-tRNA--protein transferase